jgi:thiamine kinase-like enzyme
LVEILDAQPITLVHGDAYPGNVLRPQPGTRVWIDWEDSLVGPAAFDLAAFFGNGPWLLGRSLSRREWLDAYRAALRTHQPAIDESFDAALLVWTLSQSLDDLLLERGTAALEAFVAERIHALDRLGM